MRIHKESHSVTVIFKRTVFTANGSSIIEKPIKPLKSASVFNLALTWNDWYCFQCSENSECSQCWDIAQVHKLCQISVIGEFTHKHNDSTQITVGDTRGLTPYTNYFLPGITEIVFKALNTLKVRRAETLPRFTNSVTYL